MASEAKKEINKRIRELQSDMEIFWLSFIRKPDKIKKMRGIKSFITTKKNMG